VKLVFLTGPVASGKTTIAQELVRRARLDGLESAAIDMDEVIFMINGTDWRTVTAKTWSHARRAAGSLVGSFFAAGIELVCVSGPFFGQSERDEFVAHVGADAHVMTVVLEVPLEVAIARAALDHTRSASKDPKLLAALEKSINWRELPPDAIRVATANRSPEEVATELEPSIFA
jgi:adenylylsulfate kinase-like enzyme